MNSRTLAGVAFSRFCPNCFCTRARNRSNFEAPSSSFQLIKVFPLPSDKYAILLKTLPAYSIWTLRVTGVKEFSMFQYTRTLTHSFHHLVVPLTLVGICLFGGCNRITTSLTKPIRLSTLSIAN